METKTCTTVLKIIADHAFNLLLCKNCTTIESVLSECRRIDQRIDCLTRTATVSSSDDVSMFRWLSDAQSMAQIVRRELKAVAPAVRYSRQLDNDLATKSLIQSIVQQANMGIPTFGSASSVMPQSSLLRHRVGPRHLVTEIWLNGEHQTTAPFTSRAVAPAISLDAAACSRSYSSLGAN